MFSKNNNRNSQQEDVKVDLFKRTVTHYSLIFVLGIVLLVVYSQHYLESAPSWVEMLVKELGMACLIAVILVFLLERFSKERHDLETKEQVHEMNKNLFHAIFRKRLPVGVMNEMEDCLLHTSICRHNLDLHYKLSIVECEPAKYIRVEYDCEFELENNTNSVIQHRVRAFVELPVIKELQPLCEISNVSYRRSKEFGDVGWVNLTEQGAVRFLGTSGDADEDSIDFVSDRDLPIQRNEKVKVKIKAVFFKNLYDSEVWTTFYPTEKCRLQVIVPNSDLKIFAKANNSTELIEKRADSNLFEWVLDNGMFPHQSISFWWAPK